MKKRKLILALILALLIATFSFGSMKKDYWKILEQTNEPYAYLFYEDSLYVYIDATQFSGNMSHTEIWKQVQKEIQEEDYIKAL